MRAATSAGTRLHAGVTALVSAVALCAALPARADGDAGNGAKVFATHCAECHSLRAGKDKKGPSLFQIQGRPAASVAGFVYSDALKASSLVWNTEALDAYVAAPARKVPGGKMKFDGLGSAVDRADLLAYLAAAGR
jgi:cytochrome c